MFAERVGRVVVGLVTCQGSRGRGEASFPSIPNRLCDPTCGGFGILKKTRSPYRTLTRGTVYCMPSLQRQPLARWPSFLTI